MVGNVDLVNNAKDMVKPSNKGCLGINLEMNLSNIERQRLNIDDANQGMSLAAKDFFALR